MQLWHLISVETAVILRTTDLARCYLIGSGQPVSNSRHTGKGKAASTAAFKKRVLTCSGWTK